MCEAPRCTRPAASGDVGTSLASRGRGIRCGGSTLGVARDREPFDPYPARVIEDFHDGVLLDGRIDADHERYVWIVLRGGLEGPLKLLGGQPSSVDSGAVGTQVDHDWAFGRERRGFDLFHCA